MSKKGLKGLPNYKFLGSSTKGLSDVVTTLIIILISLVAIGLVWVVVQNVLQEGSEQAGLGEFTLDLQIKSVQLQDENVTVVVVKRNPGEGEFIGMDFIFSDGEKSEIIRKNVSLNQLEQKSFIFELSQINLSNLKTVSVAPVYMLSTGKVSTGNLADQFDIPANKSIGTEQNGGNPPGTGGAVSKFESHGFRDAGTTEYNVDPGSEEDLPTFSRVIIDPLDVHIGQTQTFTAYVGSPYNVTNVTTVTELDNETLYLDLVLQQDGSWSASWQVYDTHEITYWTTFIATDAAGNENNMTLTWTDPTDCGTYLSQGQASTITGDCTLTTNEIDGLDHAKLTIGSSATVILNSGSTLVYTNGYSLQIDGRIVKSASGAAIRKGYIGFTDADGDGYAPNLNYIYRATLSGIVPIIDYQGPDCTDSSDLVGYCPVSCSDPDGSDHFTQGTVTFYDGTCSSTACNSAQYVDYCFDGDTGDNLIEYTCEGGVGGPEVFQDVFCSESYGGGTFCYVGACLVI